MWDVLLLFSSICTAVVVGAPETVIGHRGERVDIRCPYDSGYESNSKYFCKGECNYRNRNIMVRSGSPAEDERFSLTDDTTARVFTVTITDLRTEDAGRYWCVVERTYTTNVYSEILLKVKQDKKTTEVSTISSFPKTQSFSTTEVNPQSAVRTDLASVAGGLGSVLLVLTLCSGTFLILKKKKRKHGTAKNVQHNTETDCMYEIPNTDVAAVTSSSNQTPASHLNNLTKVSIGYSTVTNQQPDSTTSHTHSTNQVTDTDCDYYAKIKSPEATQDSRTELIYTTATHPQNITTDEGPIYSVINQK